MRSHWTEIEKYLEDQKIAQELIGELRDFHMRYEVEDQVKELLMITWKMDATCWKQEIMRSVSTAILIM